MNIPMLKMASNPNPNAMAAATASIQPERATMPMTLSTTEMPSSVQSSVASVSWDIGSTSQRQIVAYQYGNTAREHRVPVVDVLMCYRPGRLRRRGSMALGIVALLGGIALLAIGTRFRATVWGNVLVIVGGAIMAVGVIFLGMEGLTQSSE